MSALACAPGPWSMLNNTCAMPSVAQEDAAQHVRWQLGWSTSQVRMVRILVSICFNLFQPTFVRWTNWYFDFQKHDKEARRSKFSLWNPLESFGGPGKTLGSSITAGVGAASVLKLIDELCPSFASFP